MLSFNYIKSSYSAGNIYSTSYRVFLLYVDSALLYSFKCGSNGKLSKSGTSPCLHLVHKCCRVEVFHRSRNRHFHFSVRKGLKPFNSANAFFSIFPNLVYTVSNCTNRSHTCDNHSSFHSSSCFLKCKTTCTFHHLRKAPAR